MKRQKKKKKKRMGAFIIDDDEEFDQEADYDPNQIAKSALKAKKRKLKKKSESKKKRRKKNAQQKPRKRRQLTPDPDPNQPNNEEDDDFKSIEDQLRAQSRGGKKAELDEGLAADESKALLKAMTNAHELDRRAMDKSELPIYRLLLLDELKEKAGKLYLQLALIEDGILEVMSDWLVPYKGKLCNMEVRSTILDLLLAFPIEGVDKDKLGMLGDQGTFGGITLTKLRKSNIGQMVSFLSQQKEETPKNKKKCKNLIEKFSRLIHGLGDNFEDDDERAKREGVSRMKTKIKYAGNTELEPGAIGFIQRATIPRVIGYDFVKKPSKSSSIRAKERMTEDELQRSSLSKEFLEKKMNDIGRKRKTFSAKYNR